MVTNILFRYWVVQQVVRIDCDIQSGIFLVKNPTYHLKTKHIDIQYHFVRDMVEEKKVLLMKLRTKYQYSIEKPQKNYSTPSKCLLGIYIGD
jgi:hypothetical protein